MPRADDDPPASRGAERQLAAPRAVGLGAHRERERQRWPRRDAVPEWYEPRPWRTRGDIVDRRRRGGGPRHRRRCCGGRAASRSLLEAGPEPGAAWRQRYDRLHLHTPRLLSGLPGRRIPRRFGRWVVARRPDRVSPRVRGGRAARRADGRRASSGSTRDGDGWRLETSAGPLTRRHRDRRDRVQRRAVRPRLARASTASPASSSTRPQYRNPAAVPRPRRARRRRRELRRGDRDRRRRRRRVAQLALSVRTPPQIVRRATAGIPAQLIGMAIRHMPPHWVDPISKTQRKLSIPDLAAQGLPRPEHGVRTSFITTGTTPILDVGIVDGGEARPRRDRRRGRGLRRRRRPARRRLAHRTRTRSSPRPASAPGSTASSATSTCSTRAACRSKTDGEPVLPGLWFVGFVPTLGGQLREGSIAARKVAEPRVAVAAVALIDRDGRLEPAGLPPPKARRSTRLSYVPSATV